MCLRYIKSFFVISFRANASVKDSWKDRLWKLSPKFQHWMKHHWNVYLCIFCIEKFRKPWELEMILILGTSIIWEEMKTTFMGCRVLNFTEWLRVIFHHYSGQAKWYLGSLLTSMSGKQWTSDFQNGYLWIKGRSAGKADAAALAQSARSQNWKEEGKWSIASVVNYLNAKCQV